MELAHVSLWVSDLERSLSFYDALGFEREWSFTADGVENVYVAADHGELQLRHDPDRTTPIAPSRADTDHIAFVVADVDSAVTRASEAGGSIVTDPHDVAAAGARAGFVEDPDGHTIELFRPLESES